MLELLFSDRYELEFTCADPIYIISKLSETGIKMLNLYITEPWQVKLSVAGKSVQTAVSVAEGHGCKVRVLGQKGLLTCLSKLKKRAVMLIGIMVVLLLTIYIPSRVLFVEVNGNFSMETSEILEKAEQVGIFFGVSRKSIRSESIKNALLEAIPQLKWAGINTYGCRAVISVVERDRAEIPKSEQEFVQGIYSLKDGVVSSITVTKGTPLCKTGEAIRAGQLLVSGYTDCGLVTRAESAEGEIYAITSHKIRGILPLYKVRSEDEHKKAVLWRVQFGKKQIKLYIGSGNYDTECGKIYESYDLTLPGGFCLPLSFIKETFVRYQPDLSDSKTGSNAICALAEKYIRSTMIAGKILHADSKVEEHDDQWVLSGNYLCEEIVGKILNEERN